MLVAIVLLLSLPFFWRQIVVKYYTSSIHDVADAPASKTAIVFGAAVFSGDRLSTVLRDRMDTAIQLYRQGSVGKLLVSGDGESSDYNEPEAMMAYAMRHGIPAEDILTDLGGRRTYDTCYRARYLFEVQDAILVTQSFHLPRALFLCGFLDVKALASRRTSAFTAGHAGTKSGRRRPRWWRSPTPYANQRRLSRTCCLQF